MPMTMMGKLLLQQHLRAQELMLHLEASGVKATKDFQPTPGQQERADRSLQESAQAKKSKKKKPWYNFWDSETKNADCGCGSKAEQTKSVARGPQLTTAQTISDLAGWFNYPQREQFLFNSEMNESMSQVLLTAWIILTLLKSKVLKISWVLKTVIFPQFTQNISGQGRTFANTIHPGMVIPNP